MNIAKPAQKLIALKKYCNNNTTSLYASFAKSSITNKNKSQNI